MASDIQIEQIVKQVIAEMKGQSSQSAPGSAAGGPIPSKSRAAMLTALEKYEIKEFDIPEIKDDEILVKVEGCGICGTDAHEFKRDPVSYTHLDVYKRQIIYGE